jgi:hypothetical protein
MSLHQAVGVGPNAPPQTARWDLQPKTGIRLSKNTKLALDVVTKLEVTDVPIKVTLELP